MPMKVRCLADKLVDGRSLHGHPLSILAITFSNGRYTIGEISERRADRALWRQKNGGALCAINS